MPRVPIANPEGGPSLPSSIGSYKQSFVGPAVEAAGQNVASSLAGISDIIQKASKDKTDREQRTNILSAQNDFQRWNIEDSINTEQNRQGSLALADENTGYKGVYKDYDETSTAKMQEFIKANNVNPEYADIALEKLGGIKNQNLMHRASWESAQLQQHQKAVFESAEQTFGVDIVTSVQSGGGVAAIDQGVENIRELIKFQYPNTSQEAIDARVQGFANTVTKNALQAWAEVNPIDAMSALKSEDIKKYLDAADIVTMEKTLEQKVLPFKVQNAVGELTAGGMSYENNLQAARIIYKSDPELLKAVEKDLDGVEAERKDTLAKKTLQIRSDYINTILDRSKPLPTHNTLFKELQDKFPDKTQADDLKAILALRDAEETDRKPKKDTISETEKAMLAYFIGDKISRNNMSVQDVLTDKSIPDFFRIEAVRLAQENEKEPSIGKFISDAKDQYAPVLKGYPEVEAQLGNTLRQWSKDFKQQNGKLPRDDEFRKQTDSLLKDKARMLLTPGTSTLENIFGAKEYFWQSTIPENVILLKTPAGRPAQAMYKGADGRFHIRNEAGQEMVLTDKEALAIATGAAQPTTTR